jgi:hypothetical protein
MSGQHSFGAGLHFLPSALAFAMSPVVPLKLAALAVGICFSVLADPLHAAPLMLNFTSSGTAVTNVSPTFDARVSAGHAAGAISLTDVSWNNLQTGDVSSGLIWGDGTAADGIAVNLGVSPSGSNVINFANNPSSVGLGTTVTAGIYSDTRVARYGIWGGGSAGQNIALGVRIDGLVAGTYQIYVTGKNTNSSNNLAAIFYASAAGLAATYDFSAITNTANVANTTGNSAAYAVDVNYGLLTVTVGTGQSLFLATEGTTAEQRGFLNSLQIVAVPEPSSLLLVSGGLLAGLWRRRRR